MQQAGSVIRRRVRARREREERARPIAKRECRAQRHAACLDGNGCAVPNVCGASAMTCHKARAPLEAASSQE
eukprot:5633193-Pleurochrysis_carterae.AAC.1